MSERATTEASSASTSMRGRSGTPRRSSTRARRRPRTFDAMPRATTHLRNAYGRTAMSRRTVLWLPVAIALVLAPLAFGSSAANAATIEACINDPDHNGDGRLARIVAANEPCRRNETRVTWDAAGLQ